MYVTGKTQIVVTSNNQANLSPRLKVEFWGCSEWLRLSSPWRVSWLRSDSMANSANFGRPRKLLKEGK